MKDRFSDTSSIDKATAYRLLRVARLLRHDLAGALARWDPDLTPEQYFVLFRLHERDGRAQRELVDPVLDDRANITRLVDKLQARGLVERRPDPDDGRRNQVWLTDAGRALFDTLLPRIPAERRRLFGDLAPGELDALHDLLDRLEDRLG
ncbi:MAG: MarR family transcriptional regulator [Alphaproteobacteria bacterium]|nr:MarR family transcriptional regulator [Alphaproteobacteria bacterium]